MYQVHDLDLLHEAECGIFDDEAVLRMRQIETYLKIKLIEAGLSMNQNEADLRMNKK